MLYKSTVDRLLSDAAGLSQVTTLANLFGSNLGVLLARLKI